MVVQGSWDPIDSLGPTGTAVAANVKRLRESQGISHAQMTDMLELLGRTIPAPALGEIECGRRSVDPDDLLALAVVLRTSPASLLMPYLDIADCNDRIEIAGSYPVEPAVHHSAQEVWEWLTAQRPIIETMDLIEFGLRSWPRWIREAVLADLALEEQATQKAMDMLIEQLREHSENRDGNDRDD